MEERDAILARRDELAAEMAKRRAAEKKEALQAEMAKRDLAHFLRAVWPILEKKDELMWGRHIDAVCLPYESAVETDCGPMAIGLLVESGWSGRVLSRNDSTGEVEWRSVTGRMKSAGRPLVSITTSDGTELLATDSHPVFTRSRGYGPSSEVVPRDEVLRLCPVRDGVPEESHPRAEKVLLENLRVQVADQAVAGLCGLRQANGHPWRNEVPGVLGQDSTEGQVLPLCGVRDPGVQDAGRHEDLIPDAGGVLRRCVHGGVSSPRTVGLHGLQIGTREELWGEVPEVLDCHHSHRATVPVRPVRNADLHDRREAAVLEEEQGGVLRSPVLRHVLQREEQSAVRSRQVQEQVPEGVQEDTQKNTGERRPQVLPVPSRGHDDRPAQDQVQPGGPPHRLGYGKQRAGKSRHAVLPLSPQAAGNDLTGRRAVWDSVEEVGRSLRLPDFVYNIEVEGNNNYFANGVLVHNCNHITAVGDGRIRNLAISLPPSATKTRLIMEAFPAWLLGRDPRRRILCVSSSEGLAEKSSLACRDILRSEWYRKHFPQVVISDDQDTKLNYRTTQGGYRQSKPILSKVIGEKADIILCFPGDTEIDTSRGRVAISTVARHHGRYGVATFNHETGEVEYHKPVEVFRSRPQSIATVKTDGGVFSCTPEHPVFAGGGYVPAWQLKPGDTIFGRLAGGVSGEKVLSVESYPPERREVVYNLDTGPNHNYFAGCRFWSRGARRPDSGYLVHNCDDPNDAQQVLSKSFADSVRSWYERSLHNRVNSPITGCRIAVAQRTSINDLIGLLVESFGFEYLFLPEEFEPDRRFTSSIGWTDWRTEEGELLRPHQYGPDQIAVEKKRPYYQSFHQQNPSAEEQAFFKREYFRLRWHFGHSAGQIVLPSGDEKQPDYRFDASACLRFATIDAAAAAKTSADHTACVVFVLSPRGDLVILDCILRQVDIPDQPKVLAEIQAKHAPPVIGIERCGANAAMYQFARKLGYSAVALDPGKSDKLVRANPAIMRASEGRLWLPADGLIPDFDVPSFVSELVMFRGDGKGRDDVVDCLSLAHQLMPMLPSLSRGNQFRPTAVDAAGGGSRMPMGAVPIPPVGGVRAGSPAPAGMGGGGFRPSVIRPGSPFGR